MTRDVMADWSSLRDERYIILETFRRDGTGVRTPVWFATDPRAGEAVLYVYTGADSGKVKRLRRSARARIAACDMRGRVKGAWIEVRAEAVTGTAFVRGMRLLDAKYWPWKQLLGLISRLPQRRLRTVIAIRPA
jgi:PPOX class probable F420-dependent enzyme